MQFSQKFHLPEVEEKILKFWEENKIFEKSLERTRKRKPFVFYEGPPTANGLPHIGHALTRAFKDLVLRYKTMRGFYVPRRAGWDTHGLPVEIEAEKELGLKSKQEIEKYGIVKFNQKAKESVFKYKDEWERSTRRLGFWLNLESPYITYQTPYIETLWRIVKEFWRKGFLYKDFKVLPWCPRCQTGLSTHELGQSGAYQTIQENSIYVKLKIKGRRNEYLLIWTTTPWTLPANVSAAVNPKIEYSKFKINGEFIWSAKTPPYDDVKKAEVAERASGRTLVGLRYEPLFKVPCKYSLGSEPLYQVYGADFVSAEEGSGIVHIAPSFGEEDLNLVKFQINHKSQISGSQHETSYPILQTVSPEGIIKKGVIGDGKFIKDANQEIIKDLERRGLLLKIAPYEHDYPFCWRCGSPLLYYAKTAWWIRVTAQKEKLLANNEKINWIPEHIKSGRFGEFLREVRDWAFSRERFWGTPLSIWECQGKFPILHSQVQTNSKFKIQNSKFRKGCGNIEVIGSRDELAKLAGGQRNRYLLMRHGEALSNINNLVSYAPDGRFRETLRGRLQAERAAKKLKKEKIDLIFSSDILRTKETAEIAAKVLGIRKIHFDPRLREINTGIFEGKSPKEYHAFFSSPLEKFTKRPPEGETLTELRARMLEFLEELEKKYSSKTILIVSHEYPLWMLYSGALGLSNEETIAIRRGKRKADFIGFAEVLELIYKKLPRNGNKEVDLHRPYVDDFEIVCSKCGGKMRRVPEVADVWFDSGSMPFASDSYAPGVRKILTHSGCVNYPADFICEAVDQTRGWFYTLLVVATLLGRGAPYKNVISLGHVLDKHGKKMSKSIGNVVDPQEMMQKYGADALRWYFYTINPPGEPKKFDEKDLLGKLRGFLLTFWNSFVFFDTYISYIPSYASYAPGVRKILTHPGCVKNVLDHWVSLKLQMLVATVTKRLDNYDVTGAAREIENFIVNDFSQWYLRRSRRRFQHPQSPKEKNEATKTLAYVILELCRISAPFIPFLAEAIYRGLAKKLKLKEISAHLLEWPASLRKFKNLNIKNIKILKDMAAAREIAARALKLRADAGIKVRQPLARLEINQKSKIKNKEILDLIKDEVNVKEIVWGDELKLDTFLTPELKEEGIIREVIRNLQEMRRDLGLHSQNKIRVQFYGARDLVSILEKWKSMVLREAGVEEWMLGGKRKFRIERELDFGGVQLWIGASQI